LNNKAKITPEQVLQSYEKKYGRIQNSEHRKTLRDYVQNVLTAALRHLEEVPADVADRYPLFNPLVRAELRKSLNATGGSIAATYEKKHGPINQKETDKSKLIHHANTVKNNYKQQLERKRKRGDKSEASGDISTGHSESGLRRRARKVVLPPTFRKWNAGQILTKYRTSGGQVDLTVPPEVHEKIINEMAAQAVKFPDSDLEKQVKAFVAIHAYSRDVFALFPELKGKQTQTAREGGLVSHLLGPTPPTTTTPSSRHIPTSLFATRACH
jgi:hypothetical protein